MSTKALQCGYGQTIALGVLSFLCIAGLCLGASTGSGPATSEEPRPDRVTITDSNGVQTLLVEGSRGILRATVSGTFDPPLPPRQTSSLGIVDTLNIEMSVEIPQSPAPVGGGEVPMARSDALALFSIMGGRVGIRTWPSRLGNEEVLVVEVFNAEGAFDQMVLRWDADAAQYVSTQPPVEAINVKAWVKRGSGSRPPIVPEPGIQPVNTGETDASPSIGRGASPLDGLALGAGTLLDLGMPEGQSFDAIAVVQQQDRIVWMFYQGDRAVGVRFAGDYAGSPLRSQTDVDCLDWWSAVHFMSGCALGWIGLPLPVIHWILDWWEDWEPGHWPGWHETPENQHCDIVVGMVGAVICTLLL